MEVEGYRARRHAYYEHDLPAVMNTTIAANHPVMSGGGRLIIGPGLAWTWEWVLGGCLLGSFCGA